MRVTIHCVYWGSGWILSTTCLWNRNTCVDMNKWCKWVFVQARRSSQSEAVALQAIRNAKGNSQCVDCEAPSEFLNVGTFPASCTFTLEHNSHHAQTVVVQPLAHSFFLLSSLSSPILQIPLGPVSIWVRWSASSAQGSTETWGLTCPVCARWTWTTGRESSHRCWLPSETTWPTASGRAAPKDGPNPHRVRHGGLSQITAHVKNCCKLLYTLYKF